MYNHVKEKFETFVNLAENEAVSRPWLVVILMHEYYRNLYPEDPYIPLESSNGSPMLKISRILDHSIETLNSSKMIGSYFDNIPNLMDKIESSSLLSDGTRQEEGATQRVYGKLWDRFETDEYIKDAYRIIESRLNNNEFDLSFSNA
jgi:hypothetical protein|tara:strand:+ start:447 stop:887 length:441 start_codon:yes stop_codon:yes gene_type:complete